MDIPIVQLLLDGIKFAGQVIPAIFKKPEPPPTPTPPAVVPPNVEANIEVNINSHIKNISKVKRRKLTAKTNQPAKTEQSTQNMDAPLVGEIIPSNSVIPSPISEIGVLQKPISSPAIIGESKTVLTESKTYITENRTFFTDNRTYIENNLTIVQRIDKKFFIEVIDRASENLTKVISTSTKIILQEMRQQEVRKAVQDIQADIRTLHKIASYDSLDSKVALQMMTTLLIPLQVHIEYARLVLTEPKDKNLWNLCYLSGTTALITGYAFLGQEIPALREDLESKMQEIQVELLDEVTRKLVSSRKALPLVKFPLLLHPEGADELLELYMKTLKPNELKKASRLKALAPTNSSRSRKRLASKQRKR